MADPELARDDAGADAGGGHLDDLEADVVGQRPAVDEHAAQLVDAALACEVSGGFLILNRGSVTGFPVWWQEIQPSIRILRSIFCIIAHS